MLLVEKNVALSLPDGNVFKANALASEEIDYQTFKGYKDAFKLILKPGDESDGDTQYIPKKAFDKLVKNDDIKKIAFVFLTKKKNDTKRLSVAMLGLDINEKFVYEKELLFFNKSFQSNRVNEINNPAKIGKDKSGELKDLYKTRREDDYELNYLSTHDMGVWHCKTIFEAWLSSVTKYAEVHFGVQQPNNFQVVMLVSDESLMSSPPQLGTKYAFDQGNGCCPEQ